MLVLFYILALITGVAFVATFGDGNDGAYLIAMLFVGFVVAAIYIHAQDPLAPTPLKVLWSILSWTFFILGGFLFLLGFARRK